MATHGELDFFSLLVDFDSFKLKLIMIPPEPVDADADALCV